VYADIDRVRAEMLEVPANRVFETLQVSARPMSTISTIWGGLTG
jgi:hypothetical protein